MNIYIIVEGEIGSVNVYKKWIKYINPNLNNVDYPSEISENNYYILGGQGYPRIKDIIRNSIDDINTFNNIDRFVVAIDAEDSAYEEKHKEFSEFIEQFSFKAKYFLIIQNSCLETWALGNRKISPIFPKNEELIEFKKYFDVSTNDPELLPPYSKLKLNRSQFAFRYLVRLLNDKYRNISYSKTNTSVIQEHKFFIEIRKRMESTNHLQSFNGFINAFT